VSVQSSNFCKGYPEVLKYESMLVLTLAVALAAGQLAPDFRLPDQDGKAIKLSAARGHKVVLVFYRGYW